VAERSIRAILRAEVGQYTAAMGEAAKSTEQVGAAAEKSAQTAGRAQQTQTTQARSFSQRLAASARENEQAWTTVGTAVGGVGAAMGGVLAVVGTMGGQYNALRQTATQALTAITGSAEEAAAQMARMDEFGSQSWLMRDSIIRAQQTMTGFGIETGKVIGYMDSLAEATAAAGGTSQDFEELARIMGQVNSQGKITAETLNQFGIRGVDAAQMIADAMGTTAGAIREQITAGTLDAGAALDALSEGMMMNFEGSSDLVRNTFSGAVADVTAAVRDIGAIMMSPLIDPEGGGFLTEAIGQVGDFLFAIRDLPDGVVQVGGALAAITAGVAGIGGAAAIAYPKWQRFWDNVGQMTTPQFAAGLRSGVGALARWGGALGITSVALGAIANAISDPGVARGAAQIASSIREIADAGGELADLRLDEVMSSMGTFGPWDMLTDQGITDVLDKLLDPSLSQTVSSIFGSLGLPSWAEELQAVGAALDEALTFEVESGNIVAAQEAMAGLGYSAEELAALFPSATAALEEVGQAAGETSPIVATASEAMLRLSEAYADGVGSFDALGEAISNALDGVREAADGTLTLDEAWSNLSLPDITEELNRQADAIHAWNDNLREAARTIGEELPLEMRAAGEAVLEYIASMGPEEGAGLLQEFIDAAPAERAALIEAYSGILDDIDPGEVPWDEGDLYPEVNMNFDPAYSDIVTFGQTAFEEPYVAMLAVDTGPAEIDLNGFILSADEATGTVTIDGNAVAGGATLGQLLGDINESTGTVDIHGHSVPAELTLHQLLALVDGSVGITDIYADDVPAQRRLERFLDYVRGTSSATNVTADTAQATEDVVVWMPPGKTVNVDANLSPAQ